MKQEEWNGERNQIEEDLHSVQELLILTNNLESLLQAEKTYIEQCINTLNNILRYWSERSVISQQRFVDGESQDV